MWAKLVVKQDSPPAWTQEAYRPPHSKCSLCWSIGGGYPEYPPQTWDGVPPQTWDGVTPGPEMGYPPTLTWDGVPPTLTWDGVPPLPGPEMGYPPTQTWDGVPPLPRPEMGYPPRNVNRQTPVKTVPSRHTMYAGGNYLNLWKREQPKGLL